MTRITIENTPTIERIPVGNTLDIKTIDAMVERSFDAMNDESRSQVEQDVGKTDYIHWKTLQDEKLKETFDSLREDMADVALNAMPRGKSFTLTKDPSFKLTAEHDETPES